MPKSSKTVSLAPVCVDGVEKFNAAEMGSPRESHGHKRGNTGRNRNRGNPENKARAKAKVAINPGVPTPERIAKGDGVAKTPAGHYRAPAPIERLRDQGKLDSVGYVNEAMYRAAIRFEELFYSSGLTSSCSAQDLTKTVVAGGDAPAARYTPKTEREYDDRQKWRAAVKAMGYFEAHPYRGAARLIIDVICYGMGVKEASAIHCPGGSDSQELTRGMDRLTTGLLTMAHLWRMC